MQTSNAVKEHHSLIQPPEPSHPCFWVGRFRFPLSSTASRFGGWEIAEPKREIHKTCQARNPNHRPIWCRWRVSQFSPTMKPPSSAQHLYDEFEKASVYPTLNIVVRINLSLATHSPRSTQDISPRCYQRITSSGKDTTTHHFISLYSNDWPYSWTSRIFLTYICLGTTTKTFIPSP